MWIELCKPKNIKEYESFEWSGSIKIRVQVFPTYLDITARDLVLLQASLIIDFTEECCTKSFDDKKKLSSYVMDPHQLSTLGGNIFAIVPLFGWSGSDALFYASYSNSNSNTINNFQ